MPAHPPQPCPTPHPACPPTRPVLQPQPPTLPAAPPYLPAAAPALQTGTPPHPPIHPPKKKHCPLAPYPIRREEGRLLAWWTTLNLVLGSLLISMYWCNLSSKPFPPFLHNPNLFSIPPPSFSITPPALFSITPSFLHTAPVFSPYAQGMCGGYVQRGRCSTEAVLLLYEVE